MTRGGVDDFMSQHGGEFGFAFQFGEQTAIQRNFSTR